MWGLLLQLASSSATGELLLVTWNTGRCGRGLVSWQPSSWGRGQSCSGAYRANGRCLCPNRLIWRDRFDARPGLLLDVASREAPHSCFSTATSALAGSPEPPHVTTNRFVGRRTSPYAVHSLTLSFLSSLLLSRPRSVSLPFAEAGSRYSSNRLRFCERASPSIRDILSSAHSCSYPSCPSARPSPLTVTPPAK